MCLFPSLKWRQESKARSSGFGCQLPEVLSLIVFKFNEKALKDFNNTPIWKKTLLSQRWSIYEQEWGQRPLPGAGGGGNYRSLDYRWLCLRLVGSWWNSWIQAEPIELTGSLDTRCEWKQRVRDRRCTHIHKADITVTTGGGRAAWWERLTGGKDENRKQMTIIKGKELQKKIHSKRPLAEKGSIFPPWPHKSPWNGHLSGLRETGLIKWG